MPDVWTEGSGYEAYVGRWSRRVASEFLQWLAVPAQSAWLDFGCGYGRVIRFLVERVPPDRIWASDVAHEAVDFCRSEFGVHPL